jgi:SMI1-KNR4 cell-wall
MGKIIKNMNTNILSLITKLQNTNFLNSVKTDQMYDVENILNIKFLEPYKSFILNCGNGISPYFDGCDYKIDSLIEMQKFAVELLLENGVESPENIFVFFMHQGYQFHFFKVGEKEDLNVYYYNECISQDEYFKFSNSFEDFLEFYHDEKFWNFETKDRFNLINIKN